MPGGICQHDLEAIYQEANIKVDLDFKTLIMHLERRSLVKNATNCANIEEWNHILKHTEHCNNNDMQLACMERYEF